MTTELRKRKRQTAYRVMLLVILVVGTCYILIRKNRLHYYENSGRTFGTEYNVKYKHNQDLHDSIVKVLAEVDRSLSMFNDSSIISRINRNEPVVPDADFIQVFTLARKVSEATDGAFDITVAPLVNLWGFGFEPSDTVSAQRVDSIRSFVGYRKVALQNGQVVKQDGRIMLDCSAIAKGYGVDRVARLLDRQGIHDYMVEIGGEIVVKGYNDVNERWKIGIEKPADDTVSAKGLQVILPFTNCAIATSGNYRNYYYKGGRKYAHTIDPHTGYPVQHSLLSATVVAPTCAEADAYATAFMVMGVERARQLLQHNSRLKGYLIYADHSGHYKVWTNIRDIR